ncbi:LLM class flavin-dependent oxidoreductase [Streptomyces sp. JHA26]|uniref:LLM class flavin-dependent oxidoreductase n=1 Tax=Streptomyces sp. JHA26 TaxID=1917143 RepID=UPI00098AB61E|nr:LLM class flavin-dependent oxidoreductase [Streptomyces sp. JHA26]
MTEFGVNFFPVVDPAVKSATDYYDETLRLIERAEDLGFTQAQTVEHYFTAYGGYSPDPVTLLTAAAARTTRIRLATGAVVPAFTHPVKLAGKLAMLDHISHGRLDVGFGRAFLPTEFEAFGIPMDESRARFAEGVEACRRLWTTEDLVWEGRFHRFGPVTLLPRPYQRPHPPIFVASATSAESCAAAGSAGHHLQVVPSVTSAEQLASMLDAYRAAWDAAGHDPAARRIQIKYTCYLSEDADEARTLGEFHERTYIHHMMAAVAPLATGKSADYPGYENFLEKAKNYDFASSLAADKVLAGDPEGVTGQIRVIRERFGEDLSFSLQFNPGGLAHDTAEAAMELFAAAVMPEFAPRPSPRP